VIKGNLKDYDQILLTVELESDDLPNPTIQYSIGSNKF
jgi:hypothetical protein